MSTSWVISRFSAPDLNGQTVEFRLPGQHSPIHGVGIFEARAFSGRRVALRIRLHFSPDWLGKDGVLFRVPQDGCGAIEIHPDQSIARYRMFAA